MILDNADYPPELLMGRRDTRDNLGQARLYDFLPSSTQEKILFTTRSKKVGRNLTSRSVFLLFSAYRKAAV